MAKRYTNKEINERLWNEVKKGRPLFVPNCGMGLSAKMQENGGADIIVASPSSWWRLRGTGSTAPWLPYGDINQTIDSILPEVTANVKDTPIITLSGCHNPLVDKRELLQHLWDKGVSGVNPFMVKVYDPPFNDLIENIGMGWSNELEFVEIAHKMQMFTLVYAYNEEEAVAFAERGADVISAHVGTTTGGFAGAKTKYTLEEATEQSQKIFDAALKVNPDILLLAHGGPIETPDDAAYVFRHTSAHGFIGGSAAERLPIEKAVMETTQAYKSYTRE